MLRSIVLSLALLAGCNTPGSTSTTGTLVPTCSPIGDGELTVFNADGSFRATTKGVSPRDGAIAVNVCDGVITRTQFVEGVRIGTARNHQPDVFVDAGNTVVYLSDLATITSTTGIKPTGLIGVTVTCAPNAGSCDPTSPAAPVATPPVTSTAPAAPVAAPPAVTATPAPTAAPAVAPAPTAPVASTASAAPAPVPVPARP